MSYFYAFIIGGAICTVGQILIDKTKMTPARIVVLFVISGVVLTGIGLYEHVVKLAGAGATVPIVGFGYSLAKGVESAIDKLGLLGAFTGGLTSTAAGITAAITTGIVLSLIFKSKMK